MKFNVDSRELSIAIGPALEVANHNCIKEFRYEGLLTLKAENDKIVVSAYGGLASLVTTISNKSSLNYSCEKEGEVTVVADNLFDGLTTMEPGDVEIKLLSGEVVITLLSKKASKRSFARIDKVVQPPNVGIKCVQSVKVKKSVFAKGLGSVIFAPAIEEKMFTYMCALMEALTEGKKQVFRFSAGTGGRFAIKAVEGEKIFEADEEIKIIFPKNNLSNIHKVASSISCDKVMIRTVEQDPRNNIPEHIMVELDGEGTSQGIEIVMCVFGIENFSKYPDLTSIINHKYSNRIYSDLKGWNYAIGGVNMSKRGHDNNIHNTEVVFESENNRFLVTPQTAHACPTPINIDDKNSVAKGEKIWFKCNSQYLREMMSCGKTGRIQLNFDSQESLNDIPDDKPKQMRPVLIKFPEVSDDIQKTKENFYMFFTVSTK